MVRDTQPFGVPDDWMHERGAVDPQPFERSTLLAVPLLVLEQDEGDSAWSPRPAPVAIR